MRLFGGDRINSMMDSLGSTMTTRLKTVFCPARSKNAQKKIESRNFGVRKHVLEYDDVLNTQRQTIYAQRLQGARGQGR